MSDFCNETYVGRFDEYNKQMITFLVRLERGLAIPNLAISFQTINSYFISNHPNCLTVHIHYERYEKIQIQLKYTI